MTTPCILRSERPVIRAKRLTASTVRSVPRSITALIIADSRANKSAYGLVLFCTASRTSSCHTGA